ncbi:molybdopterin-guanine dinucleotide biosynthesis protein A [Allochromatium warmingii]|uniref:Molybdenum cofactor guanylyltransferase n=1 Tax=Allochromatium warmingii TaxID=61595 RepID=A0A1H3GXV1_ALLWA|nr:molybdenum cofactor guanylyltransferase MobA [Allochromatium warmingii]SDY07795.1 molybdopterin-guanine dinucleotide biosynthesis protein A [Allochromatium warmingii]
MTPPPLTGVILAGGRARRFGGLDKGLLAVGGRPLIAWTLAALAPQVSTVLINANRHLAHYAAFGCPVVADPIPDHPGPLVGFLAGMRAAHTDWIVTLPCDGPQPPTDLVARLVAARLAHNAELAVATDGQRQHAIHALLPVALAADLEAFIQSGGRRVTDWQRRYRLALADFSDQPDAFDNLNTPLELEQFSAQRITHSRHD